MFTTAYWASIIFEGIFFLNVNWSIWTNSHACDSSSRPWKAWLCTPALWAHWKSAGRLNNPSLLTRFLTLHQRTLRHGPQTRPTQTSSRRSTRWRRRHRGTQRTGTRPTSLSAASKWCSRTRWVLEMSLGSSGARGFKIEVKARWFHCWSQAREFKDQEVFSCITEIKLSLSG